MDSERRIMDQIYYNLEKYSLNKVTQWFYGPLPWAWNNNV